MTATKPTPSNKVIVTPAFGDASNRIAKAHKILRQEQPKKIDPNLQRDLKHGWLLPYLLGVDDMTWRRWDYWCEMKYEQKLPDRPIPRVDFLSSGYGPARAHLERCLDLIPNSGHGSWLGWGSWEYVDYFFDWLLYGFGHPGYLEQPTERPGCVGSSMRLYQYLNLGWLLTYPHDYWGALLAENNFGKRQGFYPTPMGVTEMMAKMLFHGNEDLRLKTVLDPCVGTGRMLLSASNYSLRLHGQDILLTVCKATLINGYLYAPWMVKPLAFFDSEILDPAMDEQISDQMVEAAPTPEAVEYLADTVHDAEAQPMARPIKIRKKKPKDDRQLDLFSEFEQPE